MASWLQACFSSPKSTNDVVIGFDFGTSCSKVVIQDHALNLAWAVPLSGAGAGASRYLLPSLLWLDGMYLHLEQGAARKPIAGIKRPLLDGKLGADESWHHALVVAYLGFVLRRARHWLLETKQAIYANARIQWGLNVGIPSAGYDDLAIRECVARLARCGWLLSLKDRSADLDGIEALVRNPPPLSPECGIEDVDINVVPEIVAEAVGYARSTQRNPGLHVMVDVGAGTLDIAGFQLRQNEEETDRYLILTADVQRLGAHELHSHRMRELDPENPGAAELLALSAKPFKPLPDIVEYEKAGYAARWDIPFFEQSKTMVRRNIYLLKRYRDPGSDRWRTSLPVFLCGGGQKISLYSEAIEGAILRLQENITFKGYHLQVLPKPERLQADGLADADYHRLAVAWGLSFPRYDIGEIEPPHEIPDTVLVRTSTSTQPGEFVSKDQM